LSISLACGEKRKELQPPLIFRGEKKEKGKAKTQNAFSYLGWAADGEGRGHRHWSSLREKKRNQAGAGRVRVLRRGPSPCSLAKKKEGKGKKGAQYPLVDTLQDREKKKRKKKKKGAITHLSAGLFPGRSTCWRTEKERGKEQGLVHEREEEKKGRWSSQFDNHFEEEACRCSTYPARRGQERKGGKKQRPELRSPLPKKGERGKKGQKDGPRRALCTYPPKRKKRGRGPA